MTIRVSKVPEPELPGGLVFEPGFLSAAEEAELLAYIRRVEFRTFAMHGVTAKRRIKQFGWHYAFQGARITETEPIPSEFDEIRRRAAVVAGIGPSEWAEALVIEYQPGAGIGWHLDAPSFDLVAGISLHGACRMRFQTGTGADRKTSALELPPRSMYLLAGEARSKWQHMIPPAKELRYSITLRTLKRKMTGPFLGGDKR